MKRFFTFIVFCVLCAQFTVAQSATDEKSSNIPTTSNKIKVFPNPATSVVNILGLANCAKADITISDMYGNVVLKYQWEIRNNALNLPISDITPGMYLVRIRSLEQSVEAKFYKQ